MDESSLGILSEDDMNFDSLRLSTNESGAGNRQSHSLRNLNLETVSKEKEESTNCRQTDAELLSLNFDFLNENDDAEIDFKELGLDEDELAMLTGNISDSDSEDENEEEEELWIKDHLLGMLKKTKEHQQQLTKDYSPASDVDIGPRAGTGVGCARDSPSTSEVDTETELQAIHNQNQSRFSVIRPDLEGNSVAASTTAAFAHAPRLDVREGAEGRVVSSPVIGNGSNGGDGDGSSGHTSDDGVVRNNVNALDQLQDGERICPQGIEDGESALPQMFFQPTSQRPSESYFIRPWGDESSLRLDNFQSRETNCRADGSEASENHTPVIFSIDQISARSSSLPNTKSGTYSSIHNNETFKITSQAASSSKDTTVTLSQSKPIENILPEPDLFSTNQLRSEDFIKTKERSFNFEENFFSQADGLKMLNLDEIIFQEASGQQDGANSWMYKDNLDITRPSWMSDFSHDRVSIGQFIGSKTNPLGTLDGNKKEVERPNFGGENVIVSPRSSLLLQNEDHQISAADQLQAETSSFISLSYIDKFIRDASVSCDPNALTEQVLKFAQQIKKQKKEELKELKEKSMHFKKQGRGSITKRSSNMNTDALDLRENWEPVRPSSVYYRRSSDFQTPIAVSRKPQQSVDFVDQFKKPFDLEAPFELAHQEKKKFPTSTPYCGNVSFPISLNESSWPSHILNDPTPKCRNNRIEPRTILANIEETILDAEAEENLQLHNNDDADKTLTQNNGTGVELSGRLSGGQDVRLSNNETLVVNFPHDESQVNQNQPASVQNVNLFNYHLGNRSCDKSKEFFPLAHNTLSDCDQSDVRTPVNSHIKQTFVQLPPLKKNEDLNSYQKLGTSTQLRDCDTVSLQRTSSIRVSPELKFQEVACVGIGCEAFLPIQNLTSRWLKCNFQLINLTVDDQSLPTEISPFIFKHETIIEPNSTDKFQIIYASRVPGAVKAVLQVTAQPIVQNKPGQSESTVSHVSLTAEAEHPNIDVLIDDKRLIDFGTLAEDSCNEISFGLVNIGPATVPIRLVIQTSNKPWQGFYFSKKNLNSGSPTIRSLLSSNVISFKMPGQSVGSNTPTVFNTLVAFRAPILDANVRDSIITMSATLNVEVDIPGSTTVVLHSIPLTAKIGTVHLETLKDLEPVKLLSISGKRASCKIPLRNSGSIPLILEATVSHSPRLFIITPHSLQVMPGEESEITITFVPTAEDQKISSVLLLTIYPGGPAYEIQLTAEVSTAIPVINLESNKHFLAWGGVPLSTSQDQTLLLRNSRQLREPCEIQVSVRGATDDYWLVTPKGLVQTVNYSIVSQEEFPICVRFAPTSAKHSAGKVVIKPTSLSSTKQIRFVIPLVGYGGKSKLALIGLQQDERGVYTAQVEQSDSATSILYTLTVKNVGDWAAFVKVIPSTENNDMSKKSLQSTGAASDFIVSPNEFIVGRHKTVKITVAIRLLDRLLPVRPRKENNCVGAMTILYGDEISRKRFRRALKNNPSEYSQQAINFDVTYLGEEIADNENMPPTPNDIQCFHNGISHCQLQLLSVPVRRKANADPWTGNSRPPIPASPPVRESQTIKPRRSGKSWEILPKQISFNLRKSDPKSYFVKTLHLQNKSATPLKFYFMWPGHVFNINPANGVLQPREIVKANITVIPSEITEWEGNIFAKCDSSEEEIRVKINWSDQPDLGIPSENLFSPVKIPGKEITFPQTVINCSSEFPMKMNNAQTLNQQWILSSVNPAVVKTHNGDLRKVAYSAFRFTKMSGSLKSDEKCQIPITFLPLDEGYFMQKWELVTKDSAKNIHHVTLNLTGEGIRKTNRETLSHVQCPTTNKLPTRSQSLNVFPHQREFIQLSTNFIEFEPTYIHKLDRKTVQINNLSQEERICHIVAPKPPFFVNHSNLSVKRRRFIKLPINFKPTASGNYKDILKLDIGLKQTIDVNLSGVALNEENS